MSILLDFGIYMSALMGRMDFGTYIYERAYEIPNKVYAHT